jgi:ferredoxin
MANFDEKIEENVAGKYYVDKSCIACDACIITAPEHFRINEEKGYAFVFSQPESETQIVACKDAADGCPVEAIGEDGE